VYCFLYSFVLKFKFVLLIGFSAGKPPTNAKPQNVMGKLKKQHSGMKQTREPPNSIWTSNKNNVENRYHFNKKMKL
jgi:hypothetical protein